MSKPIRITDEMKTEAQAEFAKLLSGLKMADGEINYSKAYTCKDAAAILWLTPITYSKTVALVTAFSDEVAWHGTVTRKSASEFILEDIFVYPQEVTGSTVGTDQTRYTQWLYGFDDDAFSKIRMQGHSHGNMGVSPSGVDSGHREKILGQLDDDMFYIFMIWNKSLKTHTLIYDMENNILYDDKDVTVKILGDDSMDIFLADAQEKVQKKKSPAYKVKPQKHKNTVPEPDPLADYFQRRGLYDIYDPYTL
ncbi:hypothetical protein LJC63_11235 [Ruminococcaceae bacterium OttesenSCG-928-L11]|nr:hypothetical protein [Ruminococcaceae bacterium OttesenSCG-928-L11]